MDSAYSWPMKRACKYQLVVGDNACECVLNLQTEHIQRTVYLIIHILIDIKMWYVSTSAVLDARYLKIEFQPLIYELGLSDQNFLNNIFLFLNNLFGI